MTDSSNAPDHQPGELTDVLVDAPVWYDDWVAAAGIPVVDVPLVSVGGGLGSLAMVEFLRVAGLPTSAIAVLGNQPRPYDTYRYLATNSQIPDHERLRSDAGSVMDNVWGFPSYALREAWSAKGLADRLRPLWTVATEPILAEYFTPRAGQVYTSVDRECARLGWPEMFRLGQVRTVRRRADGGYWVVHTPPAGTSATRRVAYRCRFVHVATGYPAIRFLPDLQAYRDTHDDPGSVVNAYEPHDHVYRDLIERGGTVVVRGNGIVASRVLQRILDDVEHHGARTTLVHLFRTYVSEASGPPTFRRPAADGFAYQAFNYPKAAWGGQLREQLLELDPTARVDLLNRTGGTNTAYRGQWVDQLHRHRRTGTYQQTVGTVESVEPAPGGGVRTIITSPEGVRSEVDARYVIDATGLVADVAENRVLAELLHHGGASLSPYGRLAVADTFEVEGTRSGPGRLYASGSITLGGPYAPVDSFLGLQYAALQIADDLAAQDFCPRIGPGRSVRQWWRWLRGRRP